MTQQLRIANLSRKARKGERMSERSDKDYAIEHGRYLADAAAAVP